MYKGARVAAVVPAHNEEAHIGRVIATMPDFVDEIVVVDDLSSDATAELAEAAGDPPGTGVRHQRQPRGGGGGPPRPPTPLPPRAGGHPRHGRGGQMGPR